MYAYIYCKYYKCVAIKKKKKIIIIKKKDDKKTNTNQRHKTFISIVNEITISRLKP